MTTVDKYMTSEVETIDVDASVQFLVSKIRDTCHDGYPVCNSEDQIVGFVRPKDVIALENREDKTVGDIMKTDYLVFTTGLDIQVAGRILFREGVSDVPVVSDDSEIVGIISNTDVLRSQIERTTPKKVS